MYMNNSCTEAGRLLPRLQLSELLHIVLLVLDEEVPLPVKPKPVLKRKTIYDTGTIKAVFGVRRYAGKMQ